MFVKIDYQEFKWGNYLFGSKNLSMFHEYFFVLDLERFNILVSDPVDVRDFVSVYGKYTSAWAFSGQVKRFVIKEFNYEVYYTTCW
jgi:hypothetical protein